MVWQTELVRTIRHMIDDLGSEDEVTYADDRLEELLIVAGQHVASEVDFATTYTIDVDELTFSPDPTDRDTGRDEDFIRLVCLKAACILHRSILRQAAGRAIDIRDGPVSVSLKGEFAGKSQVAKDFCQEYKDAVFAYQMGDGTPTRAILSPFSSDRVNTVWGGNYYEGRM